MVTSETLALWQPNPSRFLSPVAYHGNHKSVGFKSDDRAKLAGLVSVGTNREALFACEHPEKPLHTLAERFGHRDALFVVATSVSNPPGLTFRFVAFT